MTTTPLALALLCTTFVVIPACGSSGPSAGTPPPGGGTGGAAAPGSGGQGPGAGSGSGGAGDAMMPADAGVDVPGAVNPGQCSPVPACDATAPDPGPARAWRHRAPSGSASHRGRDLFVNPGQRQWVIAGFHYGLPLIESALIDEEIDVYLLRGCGGSWEKLGTALTTETAAHPDVEGVADAPGRLFFEIPAGKALGPGRHRVRLVVAGDLTAAEVFIEVVPSGTPVFVSDVDGTLTTSENAQFLALLTGAPADENADAPAALSLLASKGYRPLYLTARPEWLSATTQKWLADKKFPPGIVHTTLSGTGATGAAAGTFKTDELKLFAARGLHPAFAFGNTSSDADAYNNAAILPVTDRIFFQFTDSAWNGRRIESYGALMTDLRALPSVCP